MLSAVRATYVLALRPQLFLDLADLLVDLVRQLDHLFFQELVFLGDDELLLFFFAHVLLHFFDVVLELLDLRCRLLPPFEDSLASW